MDSGKPLLDRVAVVTGAARGIGRACVLRLARQGAHIVIADLDLQAARKFGETLDGESVEEEVRRLGRQALSLELDLTEEAAAAELVKQTLAKFGRIDILVNNAGGVVAPMEGSDAAGMSLADLRKIFDVNLMSTIHCAQAAAVPMRREGSGSIINMASMAGLDPSQRQGRLAHYGMAKTSVIQFTRFLAHELGPDGVRVNAVAPGTIATARIKHLAAERGIGQSSDLEHIPLRRLGTAEDIAGVVQFLAGDDASYVTGQCISACGGRVLTPS
jgi:NAD(P)-dependent dehydrogenase (short-subunit alcohol dehydrogenase family)